MRASSAAAPRRGRTDSARGDRLLRVNGSAGEVVEAADASARPGARDRTARARRAHATVSRSRSSWSARAGRRRPCVSASGSRSCAPDHGAPGRLGELLVDRRGGGAGRAPRAGSAARASGLAARAGAPLRTRRAACARSAGSASRVERAAPSSRRLGQRRLEPLAGAAERGRLLAGDLLLDAAEALAPRTRLTPPTTDLTSHCWRSRNRATVSSVRGSAWASRLMRSGTMWRTSG